MKYIKIYLKMIRYRTSLTFGLFILLGAAQHDGLRQINFSLFLSVFALISMYACATSINDLVDWKIDRINLQGYSDRPLITGEGKRQDLYIVALLSGAASLIMAFIAGLQIGILLLIVFAMNIFYSLPPLHISHHPVVTPFYLTFAYTVIPYTIGVFTANQRLGSNDKFFLPALFFLFLARMSLKDFRDQEGDAKNNKPTIILKYGKMTVCILSASSVILGSIFLALSLTHTPWLIFGLIIYVAAILIAEARLIISNTKTQELIAIGFAARMSSGMFLTILGVLILQYQHVDVAAQIILYISIMLLYGPLFYEFLFHPEQFQLGTKIQTNHEVS